MHGRLTRAKAVVVAIGREVRSENLPFMAGSIAYHSFVSLLPFLLLLLFVISRVGGEEIAEQAIGAVAGYLSPRATEVLVRAAFDAARSSSISAIGLVVLVWGTLRIFRGFDQAFSEIYESERTNTFLDQLLDGVAVFGAIGVALFVISFADTVVTLPSVGRADNVVRSVLSVGAIALSLIPMYYVFPDEDVTLREVVPGALLAGVGWTVLSEAFRLYATLSTKTEYGVVGVVILFVTWLYVGGFVLLLGAAVNAVLAGRSEDVSTVVRGRTEGDATAGDADFIAPLRELEATDWAGEVRVVTDGVDVTLPPPEQASVSVDVVDRPALLGGRREAGRLVLEYRHQR